MLRRALLAASVAIGLASLAVAVDLPRPAPDFSVNMVDGPAIPLNQYKGKVCVLAFILTTCPHCQKTVGFLSAIQKDYAARGVQVIASAIDDMGRMNVPDFIKTFHPAFPVGYNTQNDADGVLQNPVTFRLYVPQLVFIDRQGVIRAQHGGDDKFLTENVQDQNLRQQIDELLKEPAAAPKKRTAAK